MDSKTSSPKKSSVKQMAIIGLSSAVLCIIAPFSLPLPFSPIPLSLATLVLYFSLYIVGMKKAFLSCVIYLLLGMVGLPVFSGATGGLGKLTGPTGGYLIGYLFLLLIAGFFVDHWFSKKLYCALGMILGTMALYLFGTCWLSFANHISFLAALSAGVLPFLLGDAIKIILALFFGPILRKRMIKANLF